jgi:predicted DNA-binding protein YlxM (UPF0122 family)
VIGGDSVMISNATKEMVWTLHEVDKCPKKEIANKLGISRQSVYDILSDTAYKNRHLSDTYKETKIQMAESLLKGLQEDPRTKSAVDKILNIVNDDETLKLELQKQGGLRAVMGVMKVIVDTTRSAYSSAIEERRTKALEKQVKLKEQELEMRLTNPESFAQDIVIVDDIDEAKKHYKQHKEKYANN